MDRHKRLLEISVLTLVIYTSLIVGIAEGSPFPHAVTPLVVLTAVLLSRYLPALRFGTLTANVLGLLAFFLAAAELFSGNIEARLLAGAHLMSYLTWIVVLQTRQPTQYWWMIALSVLQTAIGSVLLSSAIYGLFLLGFLFIVLWSLALFSLYRSQLRFLKFANADEQTNGNPKAATQRVAAGTEKTQSPFRTALMAPSMGSGSLQIDAADRWFTTRFVSGIIALSMASVCVSFGFFVLIPRQWLGDRTWGMSDGPSIGPQLVGFSEKVSLGSFGTLLESTQRVLEVRIFDPQGQRISVQDYATRHGFDEPLFRGQIHDTYRNGAWSRYDTEFSEVSLENSVPPGAYRQEYRLQPIGTRTLFVIRPMPLGTIYSLASEQSHPISLERFGSVLLNGRPRTIGREFNYQILVTQRKPPARPLSRPLQERCLRISDSSLKTALREILATDLPKQPGHTTKQRVQQIVRYLRDSEKFSYTLQIPAQSSPEKDPVLEFLQDRRTGHCQYFATGLALLLRADGIPSRIVGGFKGGESNNLTGYFEVQQRHAHAWVEAHVDGYWVTLDATPAARAESVAKAGNLFQAWKNFFSDFWHRYVINLDFNNQQKSIYEPMKATANDAWNAAALKQTAMSDRWTALKEFLSNPRRWFSWQGGLLSFVIMFCFAGIGWTVKKIAARFGDWRRHRHAVERHSRVEFYERFRQLCQSIGLVRPATATQQEFAEHVAEQLSRRGIGESEPSLPQEITEDFYTVRFGDRPLTPEQHAAVERNLSRLQDALTPSK